MQLRSWGYDNKNIVALDSYRFEKCLTKKSNHIII